MGVFVREVAPCGAAEIHGVDCSRLVEPALQDALRAAFADHPVLVFPDQQLTAGQFAQFVGSIAPLERTSSDHPQLDVEEPAAEESTSTQAVFTRWSTVIEAEQRQTATAIAEQAPPTGDTDSILYMHPETPDVMILTNQTYPNLAPVGIVDDAHTWHSDGVHKPEPSLGTALYALRNPLRGGDTEFCNMEMIFAALPAERRALLASRRAIHHWSKALNPRIAPTLDEQTKADYERQAGGLPAVRHPAARTHPVTGRKAAFVSPRFTLALEGLEPAQSEAVLSEIFAMMEDPRYRYRHAWRDGDLVIWDNRSVNHRACGGYTSSETRSMLRATLRGDRPY